MSGVGVATATIHPARPARGRVRVPGDKSISHRVAMLSALADGRSTIEGFLESQDCLNTVDAMEALGAKVRATGPGELEIDGVSGVLVAPKRELDLGNSGTTMRLLAGLVAASDMTAVLTGDESLRSRPMTRIKTPLERMGARVELLGAGTCAPVRITGGKLHGIEYALPMASAQVKSCVLLAGLLADGETVVIEPRPTRDHTERLLQAAGVDVRIDGSRISLRGSRGSRGVLAARPWKVPADFSSAAFLMLLAAGVEGAQVELVDVGLNPRRTAFLDVLSEMGANVDVDVTSADDEPEPFGVVRVHGRRLTAVTVAGEQIPNLIDELPLVAAAGAVADGTTTIRDAGELRVKESDRIGAMARNLSQLGVEVEELPDGLRVQGGGRLAPKGPLTSEGDHRIAMAMAVLACYAESPAKLEDIACIETSYPRFWKDMESMGVQVEL